MAELSSSLPPYEEMLKWYREMNSSLRSSTVSRSDEELHENEEKISDNVTDSTSVPKKFNGTATGGRRQSGILPQAAGFVAGKVKSGGMDDHHSCRRSSSMSSFFGDSSSSDQSKDGDDNSCSLGSHASGSMTIVGTDASGCRSLDGLTPKPKKRASALIVGFAKVCRRRIPHNAETRATAAHYHGVRSPHKEEDESSESTSNSAAGSFTSDKPPPAGIRGHISRGLVRGESSLRTNGSQRSSKSNKSERKQGLVSKNVTVFPTSLLNSLQKEVGGRVA
jgi:hypothetical protein